MKRRGRHPSNALSAALLRTVKKVGRFADGNGLYLRVTPNGTKQWEQRLTIQGRRRWLGLGGWPVVSLQEARDKALANKRLVHNGGDPLAAKRRIDTPTFAEAAEIVIDLNRPTWDNEKTAYQWERHLHSYAGPVIGRLLINSVTSGDILRILTPIWTVKPETARRVRRRVASVMDWAIAQGYRADNPAREPLNKVLPKMPMVEEHVPAVPYEKASQAISSLWASTATLVTKLSLEFLILTVARSTSVRFAKWDEIDWDRWIWTIPPQRMKGRKGQRRQHRVPLSPRAVELLRLAQGLNNGSELIFPAEKSGKAISDMTHRSRMRALGIMATDGRLAVPHGFRSSFRDWCSEMTDTPEAVAEAALAHVRKNQVEAAYARSDLFDRRRKLMDQWEEYLCDAG